MTTTSEAYRTLRALLEAEPSLPPLRWQNEDEGLLRRCGVARYPAPFLYTEFDTEPSEIIAFGGGRGANRYRNPARTRHLRLYPERLGCHLRHRLCGDGRRTVPVLPRRPGQLLCLHRLPRWGRSHTEAARPPPQRSPTTGGQRSRSSCFSIKSAERAAGQTASYAVVITRLAARFSVIQVSRDARARLTQTPLGKAPARRETRQSLPDGARYVFAEGVSARVSYKAYSHWRHADQQPAASATDPGPTGAQVLRRVSSSLKLAKDTYAATEIRSDRQTVDFRQVTPPGTVQSVVNFQPHLWDFSRRRRVARPGPAVAHHGGIDQRRRLTPAPRNSPLVVAIRSSWGCGWAVSSTFPA